MDEKALKQVGITTQARQLIILKKREEALNPIRQAEYIKKTFPFSTSKDLHYVCPDWAKELLYKKYQLKKDSIENVLTWMSLHGEHFPDSIHEPENWLDY